MIVTLVIIFVIISMIICKIQIKKYKIQINTNTVLNSSMENFNSAIIDLENVLYTTRRNMNYSNLSLLEMYTFKRNVIIYLQ